MTGWTWSVLGMALLALAGSAQAADPVPVYDQVAPILPDTLHHPAVLIFSKANGYRHASRPQATQAVTEIAATHGWATYETENAAVFNPAQLKRFDIIVFNSTSGDLFTPAQRAVFMHWMKSGGRIVALHGAGGTKDNPWPWFPDAVIGARFIGHPDIQTATIHVEDAQNPAMRGLPASWQWTDEWYSFEHSPRGRHTHVLATVDEQTYTLTETFRMGADHPVIWTQCVGRGATFFKGLGHKPEAWSDPVFRSLVDGAMSWAFDKHAKGC